MSQQQNQQNFIKQTNQQSQAHGTHNQSSSTTEFHVNKLLDREGQSINSHNQSSLSRLVQVSTLQEDNSFIFLNRSPGSELRKEHELSNIPSNSQTDQVLGKEISIKQNQQSHNQSSNQQSKNEIHINIKDQSLISFGKYDSNFQIQNINNSNNLQGDIPSSQDQTQHLDYTIQPSPKQVLHVDRHSNRQSRSVSQQNLISDSNLLNCSNQSFYDSDKIIQQEIDEVVNFNEIDDSFSRYLKRNKSDSRQTKVDDEYHLLKDSQKSLKQKVQESYDQRFSKSNHMKIVSKDLDFPPQSQKQSKHNFQSYLIEHILKDEDLSSFTDKLYQQTPEPQTSKRQLENQISYKTIKEEDLEDDDIQEQRQLHVVPQQVQFFSQAQKNLRSDFAIGSRTVVFHKPNTSEQSSEQKNLNSQKFNDFNSEVKDQKQNTAFQNPLMQQLKSEVKVRKLSTERLSRNHNFFSSFLPSSNHQLLKSFNKHNPNGLATIKISVDLTDKDEFSQSSNSYSHLSNRNLLQSISKPRGRSAMRSELNVVLKKITLPMISQVLKNSKQTKVDMIGLQVLQECLQLVYSELNCYSNFESMKSMNCIKIYQDVQGIKSVMQNLQKIQTCRLIELKKLIRDNHIICTSQTNMNTYIFMELGKCLIDIIDSRNNMQLAVTPSQSLLSANSLFSTLQNLDENQSPVQSPSRQIKSKQILNQRCSTISKKKVNCQSNVKSPIEKKTKQAAFMKIKPQIVKISPKQNFQNDQYKPLKSSQVTHSNQGKYPVSKYIKDLRKKIVLRSQRIQDLSRNTYKLKVHSLKINDKYSSNSRQIETDKSPIQSMKSMPDKKIQMKSVVFEPGISISDRIQSIKLESSRSKTPPLQRFSPFSQSIVQLSQNHPNNTKLIDFNQSSGAKLRTKSISIIQNSQITKPHSLIKSDAVNQEYYSRNNAMTKKCEKDSSLQNKSPRNPALASLYKFEVNLSPQSKTKLKQNQQML
eukprot:403373978